MARAAPPSPSSDSPSSRRLADATREAPPTLLSLPPDLIRLVLRELRELRSLVAVLATCKVRFSVA